MSSIRVLITGRGSIARRHAELLRELRPEVKLGVLSSGEPADQFAPFDWLTSWEVALDWQPAAVIVASVSSSHAAELAASIRAGWPCLAEKPIVISRAGLKAVSKEIAAREIVAPVVVGCNLRYLPSLRRVAEFLRSGALGRIVRAQFEVGQDLTQWRPGRQLAGSYSAQTELGGGVLFDLMHEVDLARWLLGPLGVRAAISGQFSKRLAATGLKSDDVHVALLELPWGAPVTISLDYVSRKLVRRFALIGESATLTWDLAVRRCWVDDSTGVVELTADPAQFDIAQTYRSQMLDWLRTIDDPTHCTASTLEEALLSARLMLAMKEAAD